MFADTADKIKRSRIYGYLSATLALCAEKRIDTYSACAAFYIFMSFIPYSLILLSTVKYLPFSKEDLLDFANSILPMEINGLLVYIIDELYQNGIGILSLSIIAAIWASAKGIMGITKALDEIAGEAHHHSYLYVRAKSAAFTLLLMISMILMLVISVFGNTITGIVGRYIDIPDHILNLIEMKNVIMFFVLMILFMLFFRILPSKKQSITGCIPGAASAAFLWILFTKLFSFYLSTFNGYSMYGSFAVILVLGIWLYCGMYIMFMGALMNEKIASRKGKDNERSYQQS